MKVKDMVDILHEFYHNLQWKYEDNIFSYVDYAGRIVFSVTSMALPNIEKNFMIDMLLKGGIIY